MMKDNCKEGCLQTVIVNRKSASDEQEEVIGDDLKRDYCNELGLHGVKFFEISVANQE